MSRGKQRKDKKGKVKGFGSFYQRKPHKYSRAEFLAEQGQSDRVRTADLLLEDCAERELADDDSMKSSDWHDRTSVEPEAYKARKEAEKQMSELRESKRPKREH